MLHHTYYFKTKMYIHDHDSNPPLSMALKDFIAQGYVEIIPYSYKGGVDTSPLKEGILNCFDVTSARHKFVGIIDMDEFLWLGPLWRKKGLSEYLRQFEDIGGLGVQWVMHGSGGHLTHPKEGVRKAYTKCTTANDIGRRLFKSLVRPEIAYFNGDPHRFKLRKGFRTVNENFVELTSPFANVSMYSVANISLHHYVLKSKEDFLRRFSRGSVDKISRDISFFDKEDALSTLDCTDLKDLGV